MFEFRIRCDGLNKEKIGAFERALLVRFGWAADFVQRWHSYQAHQGLPISFEPVRSNWAEAKRTECRRSKLLERLQDRQYAASILENQIAITNAQQNVKRTIASSNLNLFGSGKSIRDLGFQGERQPFLLWQIVLVFEVNRRGDWALNALANQSDLGRGASMVVDTSKTRPSLRLTEAISFCSGCISVADAFGADKRSSSVWFARDRATGRK